MSAPLPDRRIHDSVAEASCLAAAMTNAVAAREVTDNLRQNDFHSVENQSVYRAIAAILNSGATPDTVLVMERCADYAEWVAELGEFRFLTGNLADHIAVVKDKSARRRIEVLGKQLWDSAVKETPTIETINRAEGVLSGLRDRTVSGVWSSVSDTSRDAYADIIARAEIGTDLAGISCGFSDLDFVTGGLVPGEVWIMGARPGMGKSALMGSIALNVAAKGGKVGIYSLEMSKRALTLRFLSAESQVPLRFLRNNPRFMTQDQWQEVEAADRRLATLPISIDDTRGLAVSQVEGRARKLKEELGGLDLLIVDYLQIAEGVEGERYGSREREVADISKRLRDVMGALSVPGIILAQLNRDVEKRADKRPLLSDLRESGGVEQDADTVLFLYRSSYYDEKTEGDTEYMRRDETEIIVSKNRQGESGCTTTLGFAKHLCRFDSWKQEGIF
jgi:replicative DNA helicase